MRRQARIKFQFTTPAILGGADQKKAEMRSPSIRGQLRWWFKALGYDEDSELALLGGIDNGNANASSLIVRDLTDNLKWKPLDGKGISGNKFDYFLWPMRAPQKGIRGVIDQGQIIELRFSMKKVKTDTVFPDQVLKAFLLLGSMGTRSRRCYGGVYPVDVEIDGEKWAIPNSLDSFTEELEDILDEYSNCKIIQVASPQRDWLGAVNKAADFLKRFRCGKSNPKFHQQASKWGQNDHDIRFDRDKDNCIYRASLGLPLNQRYSDRTNLSSLIEGKKRLASPMLLKILALNEGFIPIAVFFRDKFLEEGELVKIEGNGIRKEREASNDLLHTMMYPDDEEHRNIWRESQSLADFKRNA